MTYTGSHSLWPVLFTLLQTSLPTTGQISWCVLIGDDGNFFRLPRFKAKTKVREVVIRGLLFADDAVLCASSAEQLQEFLDCFS